MKDYNIFQKMYYQDLKKHNLFEKWLKFTLRGNHAQLNMTSSDDENDDDVWMFIQYF